ncbi:putative odorant receptor 83c [Toxorhynchites rutilus septentrionalis]|uniref:putative odorant receptor 83c n=1 Tax=Toxorhynchites rutilus septentrionalis TaxID=329112 RepID=UPI00247AB70A|nr:putative odorant receptor 83c [Toxorhynchites rutilus septentrionalis]
MNYQRLLKARFWILNQEALDQESSVDVYNDVIIYVRKFLKPVGVDIFKKDYRWNWLTLIAMINIATFFSCMFYTVHLNWGQWILVLESCSIAGVGFQAIAKLHVGLNFVPFFSELNLRLMTMHERHSKHKENNRVLVFCCVLIHYTFKIFTGIYFFAGLGYLIFPIYMYVQNYELVMAIRMEIPGVDPTNVFGFMVTIAYQILLLYCGIAGILAADLAIMLFVLHIIGIADLFRNSLNELDRMLQNEQRDEDVVHRQILDICVMHQELIAYENGLDSTYATVVFVQVITSVICLALTLFIYYATRNIGNILFMIGAMFQLIEFCLLGTVLTVKNDHITLALYDISWYKLSKEDQKMLSFVLSRSQNVVELTIGGLALLNMETFVEIIKTIYTYFAMMVQLLE